MGHPRREWALKSRFGGAEIPSVAKATLEEEVATARLKPRPFKATTEILSEGQNDEREQNDGRGWGGGKRVTPR